MKHTVFIIASLGLGFFSTVWYFHNHVADAATPSAYAAGSIYECETGLTPSQRAGCEIWYKATAGNDRFHTYVFQQRLGVLIDWFRVLQSKNRDQRFKIWGLINDPACCRPGEPGCPVKSYEQTFGFDWCPGDDELLTFVGKHGYKDPACDFRDAPVSPDDAHGPDDKRESSCYLAFGTSTGAMGLRKFPNPKFDEKRWRKLNGGKLGTWAGYNKREQSKAADYYSSKLGDGSVEPPFLIGMACGACHIAFDPLNPPKDPEHPRWENLKGLVGNQYTRMSEIFISGMPTNSLEWQVFSHSRPGTVDTSAVPNDQVSNAGTMNALINLHRRPVFEDEAVNRWRKVSSCTQVEVKGDEACWCEPGKPGKCWHKSTQKETVHHILKGGGDSIGAKQALQRVYNNIGSCSEQCWVNHLTDLRQLDPLQRGFGQTPMDIGQCRRDCPNFRALEDRLDNLAAFVFSPASDATDLVVARANARKAKDPNARYEYDDLVEDLEKDFGAGAVRRGQFVFAKTCARCHSSLPESSDGPFKDRDFRAMTTKSVALGGDDMGRPMRKDSLGNDVSTRVSEVGSYRCRSLHSNHLAGHIWDEFASETYGAEEPDPNVKEPSYGGRSYYRNISLLNLWAHAPFMHNNALGPEVCNNRDDPRPRWNFYRSPYVDAADVNADLNGKPFPKPLAAGEQPQCFDYDSGIASVEGRYRLYKASMDLLLNPKERKAKITMLDTPIVIDIGPKLWDDGEEKKLFGFTVEIPAGTPAGLLGNFQHKPFVVDLVRAKTKPEELQKDLQARPGLRMSEAEAKKHVAKMRALADEIIKNPKELVNVVKNRRHLLRSIYSSCTALIENAGHRFGEDLLPKDKKALTAFLATL